MRIGAGSVRMQLAVPGVVAGLVAGLVALAEPRAVSAQALSDSDAVTHVAVAPVTGVHFGEWQYASVTVGVRAMRRRWWAMENGTASGPGAIAAVEPGLAGVRAGIDVGWIGAEYQAPRETRWVAQIVGAQLGPSLLQTWMRTHVADHPTTYAGIGARVNFFLGASGGVYWRVAGRDGSRRRITVVSFGLGY